MDSASSQPSETNIPITFMIGVYNEEMRIRYVLDHAVRWADEIIVVNKSSTDRTKEICMEFGDRVKVIDVPYSPQGHEDMVAFCQFPANDWIFIGTASEIPTRKLIEQVNKTLNETNGELDLVIVPRKYYSFGIHDSRSPWFISNSPYLINRKRALITNTVHDNFRPRDPQNTVRIEYSDDCCIYHLTHSSAKDYMRAMTDYFEAEAADCKDPVEKIRECMTNMYRFERQLRQSGDELLGHYFAWSIYWMGTALFVWEKMRKIDVSDQYSQLTQQVLLKEWLQESDSELDSVGYPQSSILQDSNTQRFSIGDLGKLQRQAIAAQAVISGSHARSAGNLSDARKHLVFAIRKDPSVLRNVTVWSIWLESLLGSKITNYVRAWWRRLGQRNK